MGFYSNIKNTHGVAAMQQFERCARANSRLSSSYNRRALLLRFPSTGTKPKHLTNNIKRIEQL